MKRILAFAGSNHSRSINHQLVTFAATLIHEAEVTVLDLRSWDIPVYSIDMDPDETPGRITFLIEQLKEHDGFILASPEHNSGPSAFLKNIFDWLTRRSKRVLDGKPLLLMATSTGRGGASRQLPYLEGALPRLGAEVVATYSLPSFNHTMVDGRLSGEPLAELQSRLATLLAAVNQA
ncbi:NAD(P)H-dependent FMN reductase [Lewinella marina]|uniref:NADPH-dependent FMN reductase n=1 Tax=Neolewinella marina TaxID=438751 RepID=A0A2G0CAS3_9BACT|nr:NADPH-dependent FMN reductase [Neolewinella marina]NJB87183.1 NAD(P)H-dependent FMN reductase [Neolewinella marina]PHK97065.1 NADPH-dependent FMN reductase [Neolewinella marina]